MSEKELGTIGLDNVWKRVFGLTKLITGNVDVKQKGNLQTQINNIQVNIDKVFGNEDNPDGGIGFVEGIEASNVVEAINEVFQLGSEKKNKLVENLTVMGIKASTDETWEELLDKVLDMTDTSKDTVTSAVLLENYTAHDAAGAQITGGMPERASVTVDTTGVTQDSSYTYFGVPEGHYDENSKVRAINSDLNLKKVVVLSQQSSGWGKMSRNLYWSIDTTKYPSLTVNNFYIGISQVNTQIYNEGTANIPINKEYSNGTLHVWITGVYAGEFTCQPIMVV